MSEKNEISDFVIRNTDKYEELNASNLALGEEKSNKKLESILNSDAIKFSELGPKVLTCSQNDIPLPFVIKGPSLEQGQFIEENYEAHKAHIQLLGEEFVEPMIPVRITNPESVKKIKEVFLASQYIQEDEKGQIDKLDYVDVFVQDKRDLKNGSDLWDYIINNYAIMDDSMRTKLVTFLERLKNAADRGYLFDIPNFPEFQGETGKQTNHDNIIVDNEGPTFVDSGTIAKYEPKEKIESELISLGSQIALDLLKRKTNPEEAYTTMELESQRINSS